MKKWHKSEWDILLPRKWKYNRIYAGSIAWTIVRAFQILLGVLGFVMFDILLCLIAG